MWCKKCNVRGGCAMFPTKKKKKTGLNLKRIMDKRGVTVKEVQDYLGLGSIQSIYHWLNGSSLPTIDNLYAMSELLQVSVDEMICGNRRRITEDVDKAQKKRLRVYYAKIEEMEAA